MVADRPDPMYKYVDDKVRLIKREIQQLKKVHDAVVAEQKQALLITQRTLARFQVTTFMDLCAVHQDISKALHDKIVRDERATAPKIETSDNPLPVARAFRNRSFKLLKNEGIDIFSAY